MSKDGLSDGLSGVILHVAIDAVIYGLIGLACWWFRLPFFARTLAVVNGIAWLGREVAQHWHDPWHVVTHPQSLFEWTAPTTFGISVAVIYDLT